MVEVLRRILDEMNNKSIAREEASKQEMKDFIQKQIASAVVKLRIDAKRKTFIIYYADLRFFFSDGSGCTHRTRQTNKTRQHNTRK